jgi:hypothetical protein
MGFLFSKKTTIEMKKICNKCGIPKEYSEFHKKKDTSDGYRTICKKCVNEFMVEYRKTHKDDRKEYDKKRYEKKSDEIRKRVKKYYDENRENILEKKKIYREEKPHIFRDWEKKNRLYRNEYRCEYKRKNKHHIIWYSILQSTLQRLGTHTKLKTIEVLGYSAMDLKKHIESKFTEGMSWDN